MGKYVLSILILFLILITSFNTTTVYNSTYSPASIRIPTLGISPPTIDGDPRDWPNLTKLHPPIKVDGDISDWYTEYYSDSSKRITRGVTTNITRNIYVWDVGNGSYLYYWGEFIWFDNINDTRSTPTYIPCVDLTEIRVTGDDNYLYILVRVADLTSVGNISDPSLLLSLPIDIDMNYKNGNITTIDSDTNVSNYAPWDYQIVIDLTNPNVEANKKIYGDSVPVWDNGSPLDIFNATYSDVSTNKSYFVVNLATDSIEIAIAWSDLSVKNPWNISNVKLYAITFLGNGYGKPVTNLSGSEALDVLSKDDTDTEVTDSRVDYWVDIGFTTACEPTYYHHYVLDDKGFIQAYSDLSNDMRTDYIVNEAFDVDILSTTLWIDQEDGWLYILVHVKGLVKPYGNISPAIVILLDTTPKNLSDGVDSWIDIPSLLTLAPSSTDTELGIPSNWSLPYRSLNWTHEIWLVSKSVGGVEQYWVYVYNGTTTYRSNQTIKASEHFFEVLIPLYTIDPELGYKPFRLEIVSFAYVLETSILPGIPRGTLLDITGSNIYDVVAPYTTYSVDGVTTINAKPYAINAEVYDSNDDPKDDSSLQNGDHWIDTFNTRKYIVRIFNVTLYYRSFDKDNYIEIGEPAWINATLEYYNGTSWVPLTGKKVYFYLVSIDGSKILYLGTNTSTVNGTVWLDINDIANKVESNYYYVVIKYSATGEDFLYYTSVSNRSLSTYTILHQPFTTVLDETPYIALVLTTAIIVVLLIRYYSYNHF